MSHPDPDGKWWELIEDHLDVRLPKTADGQLAPIECDWKYGQFQVGGSP